MISHQGGRTRECGAYCVVCRVRAVRFEGAFCGVCRTKNRGNRAFWAAFWIFLCALALMMAASQAVGTWMALNVDGFGSHGRVNSPAYAGLVQPRGGMTLSAQANNLGETDGR